MMDTRETSAIQRLRGLKRILAMVAMDVCPACGKALAFERSTGGHDSWRCTCGERGFLTIARTSWGDGRSSWLPIDSGEAQVLANDEGAYVRLTASETAEGRLALIEYRLLAEHVAAHLEERAAESVAA